MSEKEYDWKNGAVLGEHSKKKHAILREYIRQYLITRCQLPQREKFRLAIIDGLSGGGKYKCGEFGSPLIFVEVLDKSLQEINLNRISQGMRPITIECLLIFNDISREAIEILKENIAPYLGGIKEENRDLLLQVEYFNSKFETAYPVIKKRLQRANCSNVFFNLDQCGYTDIPTIIIRDIMSSWKSAEIILTFMIDSMLTYLSPDEDKNSVPMETELKQKVRNIIKDTNGLINKSEWLGKVEQVVFGYLKECAQNVSPFSINNPSGWRYWLMHFANSYRARQVYNDILHKNENMQAHFGKSGLNMLSYDPQFEGQLYLFDNNSREAAKRELYDDIPRVVAEVGNVISLEDFYHITYSETAAHSDDIHEMMIENPDLEVITENGGERRKSNTIKASDTLKLKTQKSMFSMFSKD